MNLTGNEILLFIILHLQYNKFNNKDQLTNGLQDTLRSVDCCIPPTSYRNGVRFLTYSNSGLSKNPKTNCLISRLFSIISLFIRSILILPSSIKHSCGKNVLAYAASFGSLKNFSYRAITSS